MLKKPIRYAVVGLGHIAQVETLPSFRNCRQSRLTALVSGERDKRRVLGEKYRIKNTFSYDEYDACLDSGLIDAVYIALPNHLHKEYTLRAARKGIHVLCEKPMAVTADDCRAMIQECEIGGVKLMIAYRLHFEAANLHAIDLIHRQGKIGEPRMLSSIHSQPTNYPNIRTSPISLGGGPTYDLGIYDINAARYLFRSEPISVYAQAVNNGKKPYRNIEETMSVILQFPKERLASLIYSYGAAGTDRFEIAGTDGDLWLEPAYTYKGDKTLGLTIEEQKCRIRVFKERDEFAPEIDYFSDCILKNLEPEPSGIEGLADVRIIEA
ncbi:MAG: Gfo/Idh/MocA family protein, partial [Bdellovibrionota bacterium]